MQSHVGGRLLTMVGVLQVVLQLVEVVVVVVVVEDAFQVCAV